MTEKDARYWIFADIRYDDIFQLILADTNMIYFPLFGNNNKSLMCRNSKQHILHFG